MPRFSWSGLPTLPWSRRLDAVEGLVLAGGGSRASFQLGALRYLYEVVGIRPSVVVGTSAGAILTAMISQTTDADEQAANVRTLEQFWFEMRQQSDMFVERPWFTTLQARGREWLSLVPPHPSTASSRQQLTAPAEEALDGQAETLRLAMAEVAPEAAAWSPAAVMHLMTNLSRLRGASSDLTGIMRGAELSRSMYRPGPLLERLLDSRTYTSSKVSASGMTVRIAMVCLESGELRFMRQDGRLVDRDDRVVGTMDHDFSRGVLASCSIPAVFAPVELEGLFYVDGGVRENVPAEMAVKLGVDRCWVVTSSPTHQPPTDSFRTKTIAQVVARATQIMSDETERDEVAYARSVGARVIEPEVAVHTSLQVDPGLIRINRDYGWLRAAEQHLDLPQVQQKVHRRIIELRLRAHALERDHFAPGTVATEAQLRQLTQTKLTLQKAIARAREDVLPAGHETWSSTWEQHPVPHTRRPPWLSAAARQI